MRKKTCGIICILTAATLWGLFPMVGRFLYNNGSDPVAAAAMRAAVAAVIYALWGKLLGLFRGLSLRELPFFALCGLFTVGGLYYFYLGAIERLSVAAAAVLLYTAPAFVIILSRIIYKEPITKTKLCALLLTFSGCLLVVRAYDRAAVTGDLIGILLGLGAGICYSAVSLFGRFGLKRYSAELNAFLPTMFGAVALLAIRPIWTIPMGTWQICAGYLAMALVGTVAPYFLYLKGMEYGVEGGDASVMANIEVVVASLTGVVLLKDVLTPLQTAGVFIVIAGAMLPALTARSKERGVSKNEIL